MLDAYVGPPEHAPWLCPNLCRQWFVCELRNEGRILYRPAEKDFGFPHTPEHKTLVEDREAEIAGAQERGSSVRLDMLYEMNADRLKSAVVFLEVSIAERHPDVEAFLTEAHRRLDGGTNGSS
jgi:hypothetical protein